MPSLALPVERRAVLAAMLFAGTLAVAALTLQAAGVLGQPPATEVTVPGCQIPMPLLGQSAAQVAAKSNGCVTCHLNTCDPHFKDTVRLGCIDCHGGDATCTIKERAHVAPRYPDAWRTSANPVRSYTLLNHESPDFVRFVNPGDLRVAHISCGTIGCHPNEVLENRKSMMTHGCMLWGAALYNNGAVPDKWARSGERYGHH